MNWEAEVAVRQDHAITFLPGRLSKAPSQKKNESVLLLSHVSWKTKIHSFTEATIVIRIYRCWEYGRWGFRGSEAKECGQSLDSLRFRDK